MVERRRAAQRPVGRALDAGARDRPAGRGGLRGQAGVAEDLEERPRRHAQRPRRGEALPVDGADQLADRLGDPFAVEREIAAGRFDPSRVHQHPRRVEDRVDVGEPGFQHARNRADFGEQRQDLAMQPRRRRPRQSGEGEPARMGIYPDRSRALQARDAGQGDGLAGLDRGGAPGPAQRRLEMQPAAGMSRVQHDGYAFGQRAGEQAGAGLVRRRRDDEHRQVGPVDRARDIGGEQRRHLGRFEDAARRDSAAFADRRERRLPPPVQADLEPAAGQLGGRGVTAVAGPDHRDR